MWIGMLSEFKVTFSVVQCTYIVKLICSGSKLNIKKVVVNRLGFLTSEIYIINFQRVSHNI